MPIKGGGDAHVLCTAKLELNTACPLALRIQIIKLVLAQRFSVRL